MNPGKPPNWLGLPFDVEMSGCPKLVSAAADDVVEADLVGRADVAAGTGHTASLTGCRGLNNGKSPRDFVGFLP